MSIVSINATDVSKITSGQVIVDLTSVVKELVDNSIDAESDKIEITFHNHGANSVEVSDNGQGIAVSDFETLCLKHHTSKLTNFEDLSTVSTLGFRGEAMSSMCAVSKVKVVTCSAATFPRGTQLEYDSMGKISSKKTLVSGKRGTSVVVTDLFHGMPVRQKNFVKHIKREYTKTLSLLQAYLLAYTNIRFTVFNVSANTGKKSMVMGTQGGQSTVKDVLTTIYGSNGSHGLIPLDISVLNIDARFKLNMTSVPMSLCLKLTGFISDYSFGMGRAATDRQYFSINKRPVTHKKVVKIINEVYKSFNTTQSPVFVLDLQLDSNLIDVNVTPDKRLVMMQCEELTCEVIREELHSLYNGRNNFVPKSDMGVVNIGSQNSGSLQKSIDHFRSSEISIEKSVPEEISDDEDEVSKSTSNLEVTQICLDSKESPSEEKKDIELEDAELEDNIDENDDGNVEGEATSDLHGTLNFSGAVVQVLPTETAEDDKELDHDHGHECSCSHDSVDDFLDIDADEISFSSPVKSQKIPTSPPGNTDFNKKSISLFVLDDDEKLDSVAQSTQNVTPTSPQAIRNEIQILDAAKSDSDEEYYSSKSFSQKDNQEKDDMEIEHVVVNSPQPGEEEDILAPSQPKRYIGDQLQGTQSSLTLTIDQAKAYLTCGVEHGNKTHNLASLQDITEAMEISKGDFTKMEIVGQFNSGFIIVTHENKLFIVDQHALDEIYNYERLMNDLTLKPQPLVVPQVLELSPIDEMKILECSHHLGRNGFAIEEIEDGVPGRRIKLKGIPVLKNVVFDVSDLHELVHKLHEQGAGTGAHETVNKDGQGTPVRSALLSCRCTKVDRMIALRACRLSIMIGLALSSQTMSRVVKNLATLDKPWNCPHGRPTMRHLADIQGAGFTADYEF